jgi:2'-5' RNA ligase
MNRLFVALSLPDQVATSLVWMQSGVPGARWQTREQLHLTLRFIGEVDGPDANAIDDALSGISAPAFEMQLKGVGEFGGNHSHSLWVGVEPNDALLHVQKKVDTALQRVGQAGDRRKFTPHITLARLKGGQKGRVMDWLTDHALFASVQFPVNAFILYSSLLTSDGSIYRAEKAYRLD